MQKGVVRSVALRRGCDVRRAAALWLLLAAAAACGADESRRQAESGTVLQRDSAGIRIVETPGAAARSPIGWTVGAVPDLQLGSVTGDGPEQFHLIGGFAGGIVGLPEGRLAVVDGGSGELRLFDSGGRFLRRAGGLGEGPGEFRTPMLVPYVSSDSLLIFDTRLRRFTLFSSDGRAHRSFPPEGLPPERVTGAARGAADTGILMMTALGVVRMGEEGQQSDPVGVRWISLESGRDEIVAQFETLTFGTNELGDMPYILDVPFSTRPSAAMGPNGFFVVGGDGPEVREFDTDGRLTRVLRLSEAPRPVTRQEVESAIDFMASSFSVPSQARRVYEQMDFPDRWPSFQSLRVDRLGWVWAELYRPRYDETPHWMVFDPSGVARGTLELPGDLEVHDIGIDYVLGRSQDDLEVEYVRRYRLERGS